MLESKGAELHGVLKEELYPLPAGEVDYNAQDAGDIIEEYQVAGGGFRHLNTLGARLLTGDKSGRMGRLQEKIQERIDQQKIELEAGAVEEGVPSVKPPPEITPPPAAGEPVTPPPAIAEPADPSAPQLPDDAADGDNILGRGPESLSAEQADQYDLYKVDFGSEELNRLNESRKQPPELVDGLLGGPGGLRAVGTQPGMEQKIPDEGSILSVIGQMAKEIEGSMPAKALRTISLNETADLADLVNANPKNLTETLRRGLKVDPNNPGALGAHVAAAKNLFVSEARKLDEMSDVAGRADATLLQKLQWKQQADLVGSLQAMYKGAVTDIARALNAVKLPARETGGMSPDEIAQITGRDYRKLADDLGGVDNLDEAIESYRNLDDLKDRMDFIGKSSRTGRAFRAWHEVWINAILSGPWSHVKNLAGGFAAIWNDNLRTVAAAAMPGDAVSFGDAQAKIFGQFMALQDALKAAGKGYKTKEELFGNRFEPRGGNVQGELGTTYNQYDAFSAEGLQIKNRTFGAAVNVFGTVVTGGRAPTRALVAGDSFVKVVAYRGALYELAWRDARLSEKKGEAFSDHVADFVTNPPGKAIEEAQQLAGKVTLQNELEGKSKKLQEIFRGPIMSWIVPFYKTPMNALIYSRDNSIFAPFFKPYKEAVAKGGADEAKVKAQIGVGVAVQTLAAYYASTGNMTGGISNDPAVRATYAARGIFPYHFRVPGTETWLPYNTIEPVSTLIGLAVDAYEHMQEHPGDTRTDTEKYLALSLVIGKNLANKSYMVSISQFFEATQDETGARGQRFFENYASSMTVPLGSFMNEISKMQDDVARFRRKTGITYPEKIGRIIQSKTPFAQAGLPPARDHWGRVKTRSRVRLHNPNPVDEELSRIRFAYHPYPEGESKHVIYTDKQLDFFHKVTGEEAFKAMSSYMKTRDFKELQKASKNGNMDATESLKAAFRKRRLYAIGYGRNEVAEHKEFAAEIEEKKRLLEEDYDRRTKELNEAAGR